MSFFAELKRRKVFRVAAVYLVGAWLLIQIVETVFPAFGLDDAAFRILVIALVVGFAPVVILAWAFELTFDGVKPTRKKDSPADGEAAPPSISSLMRYPRFALPVLVLVLVAIGAVALLVPRMIDARWARSEAVPEIMSLVEQDDFRGAYALAVQAEQFIPDDPVLADLWQTFSVKQSIETQPSGAMVSYQDYSTPDGEWQNLGQTPIDSARLPRAALRWRFEKEGHPPTYRSREPFEGTLTIELMDAGLPKTMVHVPAKELFFLLNGMSGELVPMPGFSIGRTEVTNREYQEFVDEEGYAKREYWQHLDFERDGKTLDFDEAVSGFRDPTGRPGPAGWKGGTFPPGEEDFPVRGVSWFEAAAYAEFRDKSLPTIFEWSAAGVFPPFEETETDYLQELLNGRFRGAMMSRSNFSGTAAVETGSLMNAGPYGTYDMGGNVREWCLNATGDAPASDRYILGGSWEDPSYLFTYAIAESPWDRSTTNGLRLARNEAAPEVLAATHRPVARPERPQIPPVPDDIFSVYRDFYDYDRTDLNPTTESVNNESTLWVQETVSFDATYGDERVIAHLFIPRNIDPPYQAVIYYPATDAIYSHNSEDLQLFVTDFLILSGRVLVYPVLRGTHDRNIGLETTWPTNTRAYSDHVLTWVQDFRRTIDYIETRDDIDIDRLGFYGWSWGGWSGPIVMALDERIKAGVYISGGIPPTLARPEASSASFASRVTAPVLMISGKHDVLRPVETYQKPMFESLGTPESLKRHAILDGGHVPPMNQLIRETLDWFDVHLGPVE